MPFCLACRHELSNGLLHEYAQCPRCHSFIYRSDQSAEYDNAAYFNASFATQQNRKTHSWKQKLFQGCMKKAYRRNSEYAHYIATREQIMAHLAAPKRILEVGFGLGKYLAYLLQLGIDAYGLDLSATAVKNFQTNYPAYQQRVRCGTTFEQQVDLVYCCALFEHLDTPGQFLENISYSLMRGGFLILDGVPILNEIQSSLTAQEDINFWKPCHRAIYSIDGVKTLAAAHGFELASSAVYDNYNYRVLSLHIKHGFPRIIELRNPCLADRELPGFLKFSLLCHQAFSIRSFAHYGILLLKRTAE